MKQKFDVFVWNEVNTNEKIESGKGHLRLRISAPAALYIEAQGVEALAGYSSDFDLEVSEAVTFRVEAPEGVRAFKYAPFATSVEADGEVFTNVDRMPHESGAMAEVLKARRMLEMEKRQMLQDIRREMAITRNAAKAGARAAEVVQGESEAAALDDEAPQVEEPEA